MRFIDFFSGIGGFRVGLEMAGHECVGHCEIDKYADRSYRAMHDVKEGEWFADDITRVRPEDLPEAEVYCGGFPCQAFSIAGKRGGFKDTRGTLFFEIMRLAAVRKPKYLFLENVRGLLSHDGGRTFGTILAAMGELGYDAEWQILNSKDYGVPQNRERVFIIGHLGSGSGREVFPIAGAGEQTDIPIKRIAHRKGFCTNMQVFDPSGISGTLDAAGGGGRELHTIQTIAGGGTNNIPKVKQRFIDQSTTAQDRHGVAIKTGTPFVDKKYKEFIDKNGYVPEMFNPYNCAEITEVSPTLTAQVGSTTSSSTMLIKEATKQRYATATEGDSINLEQPNSKTRRGRAGKGVAQTLTANPQQATIQDYRIRRLTPRECFRLQGFPDELFEKAAEVNSDSQLYKQAGNSVSVPVVYEIAKRLK